MVDANTVGLGFMWLGSIIVAGLYFYHRGNMSGRAEARQFNHEHAQYMGWGKWVINNEGKIAFSWARRTKKNENTNK